MAGLEGGGKPRALGSLDDADLRQSAREFRRRLDIGRQCRDALGQGGIGWIERRSGPVHRRTVAQWRIEIVAERGAERLLVAFGDGERVHDRRPEVLALDREQLADGFCLGFQPLHPALGGGERRAGGVMLLAAACVRHFGFARGDFRFGQRRLRRRKGQVQRPEIRLSAVGCDQARFDIGELGFEPRGALLMIRQRGMELTAAGGQVSERPGQFGKGFFRSRERRIGRRDAVVDPGQAPGAGLRFGRERHFLGGEALQRRFGIGRVAALAFEVGGELLEPAVEFADALPGAGFFALQRVAGDDETLQGRGGSGLGLAQRRQHRGELGLPRGRRCLLAGARGDQTNGRVPGPLGFADLGVGGSPAQVKQQRFGAADLAGNVAVADGLARLGLER